MGIIKCCRDCVPPKRHRGCHDNCKEYIDEKTEYEKAKEFTRAHQPVMISNYDFDKVCYTANRKRR